MALRLFRLTGQPPFTPTKIPGIHFSLRLSRSQDHSAAERIRPIEKKSQRLHWELNRRPGLVAQSLNQLHCHVFPFKFCIYLSIIIQRPPLWSSDQSSWLQIRRPVFDSRYFQKKKVVGLERGPLSLVSTTEELLDRKIAAPV
jgi:hypothetical protein